MKFQKLIQPARVFIALFITVIVWLVPVMTQPIANDPVKTFTPLRQYNSIVPVFADSNFALSCPQSCQVTKCSKWVPGPSAACPNPGVFGGCCKAYETKCKPGCGTPPIDPPVIDSTLNCSDWGSSDWCKGTLLIEFTATEPQNKEVQIDGDVNGTVFACPAQIGTVTCSIVLNEGTGTVNFIATSITGKTDEGSSDWKLDSAAPTLSGSLNGSLGANGWYNSSVILSASAVDSISGIASLTVTVDGVNSATNTTITGDGTHTVVITALDNAGNTAQSTQTIKIDTITPSIGQTLSGTMGNNNYYVSALQVTANGSDATSGIASMEVRVDNGTWLIVNGAVTLADGHHTWQFRATDHAGNITTTPQQEAYIDATTPVISTSITGTTGSNNWYRSDVNISVSSSDAGSGMKTLEVLIDNGSWINYTTPISFSSGVHTYQLRATDNAGNITETVAAEIKVDKTTPSLALAVSGTKGSNGWYVSDATITANTTDPTSGIALVEEIMDNGAWINYVSPLSFSDGIHTYQFRVTDNAGNVTLIPVQEIKIDTIAPIAEIQKSWNADNAVEYSAQDAGSGLSEARLVIQKSDSIKRVIVDGDITGAKYFNYFNWDGWFNNGSAAGADDYPVFLKVTDQAGNETIMPSTVTVNFSFLSLLPAIPLLGADEPMPEAVIPNDDQQFTFGEETSNDSSNELNTVITGGEVQLSASTNNVATNFGGTINNTMLAILAAAALGAATAEASRKNNSKSIPAVVADEEDDKRKPWHYRNQKRKQKEQAYISAMQAQKIKKEAEQERNILRAEGADVTEAEKLAAYKVSAPYLARKEKEERIRAAEQADMTEDEKLAAYKATPEYQQYLNDMQEYAEQKTEAAGLKAYYEGRKAGEKESKPNWWGKYGEWVHGALDVVGFIPVYGEAFDGINGLIYLSEGRYVEAGISAAAMVPIIGDLGKGAKWGVKIGKEIIEETIEGGVKQLSKEIAKNLTEEGAEKLARTLAERAGIENAVVSVKTGLTYISKSSAEAIKTITNLVEVGMKSDQTPELIAKFFRETVHNSGNTMILGKFELFGGYIKRSLDELGTRFWDTGSKAWEILDNAAKAKKIDVYDVNSGMLREAIDDGVDTFNYIEGSVKSIVTKHNLHKLEWEKISYAEKEILDLLTMPDLTVKITEGINDATNLVESVINIVK